MRCTTWPLSAAFRGTVASARPVLKHPLRPQVRWIARSSASRVSADAIAQHSADGGKAVTIWIFTCAAMVFSTVVLGGYTRLTESGLSMVDWKPLGTKYPSTMDEWLEEFANYKEFPEFQKLNPNMSLEEFKRIFWFEYTHRMLGRAIGATFVLPFAFFVATKRIRGRAILPLSLIMTGIGCQGLMGWYMVKSGLKDKGEDWVPRVSQYRLAAHLSLAFTIYLGMLWVGMGRVWKPYRWAEVLPAGAMESSKQMANVASLRRTCVGVAHLVFGTAVAGAFVAGLDAGFVYNTFPLMAGKIVPWEEMMDPKYAAQPWRNFLETDAAVQFVHRALAISSLSTVAFMYTKAVRSGVLRILPLRSRMAVHALMLGTSGQVLLGIVTLLSIVQTPVASAHQAGSLTLLSICFWLLHTLRRLPK